MLSKTVASSLTHLHVVHNNSAAAYCKSLSWRRAIAALITITHRAAPLPISEFGSAASFSAGRRTSYRICQVTSSRRALVSEPICCSGINYAASKQRPAAPAPFAQAEARPAVLPADSSPFPISELKFERCRH